MPEPLDPLGIGNPGRFIKARKEKLESKLKSAMNVGNIIRMAGKGSIAGLSAMGLRKAAEVAINTDLTITPPPTPAQRFADIHATDPRTTRGKLG
jgi:hypothetical protein